MVNIKPVIKWTGSKRKQSEEILKHFPKKIKTYYEPFIGGGSVMFQLIHSNIEVENIICSDINEDLINLWNNIKNNPNYLIDGYNGLWNELNKDDNLDRKKQYFNEIRELYNKNRDSLHFLFISRTCVNGKIRYNKQGEFNNSFHVTRNGIKPESLKEIITTWSSKLNEYDVKFIHQNYTSIQAEEGDYIYLDPPYAGTTDMYYGGINLNEFYNWMREQPCTYVLSFDGVSGKDNYMTEVPKELYNIHVFIHNGNSTFKKVDKNKNEMVTESLYIKGDNIVENRKVHVTGEVMWGNDLINVDTNGFVIDWCEGEKDAFVNLESIGGDVNVWLYIDKDFINNQSN